MLRTLDLWVGDGWGGCVLLPQSYDIIRTIFTYTYIYIYSIYMCVYKLYAIYIWHSDIIWPYVSQKKLEFISVIFLRGSLLCSQRFRCLAMRTLKIFSAMDLDNDGNVFRPKLELLRWLGIWPSKDQLLWQLKMTSGVVYPSADLIVLQLLICNAPSHWLGLIDQFRILSHWCDLLRWTLKNLLSWWNSPTWWPLECRQVGPSHWYAGLDDDHQCPPIKNYGY